LFLVGCGCWRGQGLLVYSEIISVKAQIPPVNTSLDDVFIA
jgi:hypothetical protein